MTLRPTVRAAEPARELRWLGRLFLPGLVDGEHRLALDPLEGGRSRFIQSEASAGCTSACLRERSPRPSAASSR
jgi:hypothetical protein